MVTFHQRLETGLDLLDRRRSLQAERIERLALGIADRTGLRLVGPSAGGAAELSEHAERIGPAAKFGMEASRIGARRRPPAVHAHLPGRAMSDHGVALILGDIVEAHSIEEIVGMVVLADVIEAEPPIFLLA